MNSENSLLIIRVRKAVDVTRTATGKDRAVQVFIGRGETQTSHQGIALAMPIHPGIGKSTAAHSRPPLRGLDLLVTGQHPDDSKPASSPTPDMGLVRHGSDVWRRPETRTTHSTGRRSAVSLDVCIRIWRDAPSATVKSADITPSFASVVERRSARRVTRSMHVDRRADRLA